MQQLLLLHGAIGAKDQLLPLANELSGDYEVHLLNFLGHGGEKMPEEDFSIPMFAEQVLDYMEMNRFDQISLFGYSMGGYVAMHLAALYPNRLKKLVTLATKFHWNNEIAAREVKMLDPEKIEEKVPEFAKELKQRHGEQQWRLLLQKTSRLLFLLGESNLLNSEKIVSVTTPSLILLGDRDKMVSLDETVAFYKQLPKAFLGVLPGTGHPIEQVNVKRLAFAIREFIGQ
jgi:pimeloyl-ACP methyl ester carboxylesterase